MRGNFVSPIGNPYYEPDYEKYYYDPPWYDRIQDPESWHDSDQALRSMARKVGPLLPAAAIAIPAAAVGYTIYKNVQGLRKAKERQARIEKRRLLAEKRALKHARETNEKIGILIGELNKAGIRDHPAITEPIPIEEVEMDVSLEDNIADESPEHTLPESRGRTRLRTPSQPPEKPSFNVQLPDVIRKAPNTGPASKQYASRAEPIVHAIDRYGLESVLADPGLNKDYPDMLNILRNPYEALVSDQPFPKPFLKYLTPETQSAYDQIRERTKRQDAKTKTQARAAAKRAMYGKPKRRGKGITQSLINPPKKRKLL